MNSARHWLETFADGSGMGTVFKVDVTAHDIAVVQADTLQHAADYLASRGSTFTWDDAIAHLRSEAERLVLTKP